MRRLELIVSVTVAAIVGLVTVFSAATGEQADTAPPPFVRKGAAERVSEHVWVIPDQNVRFVPNVGFVVGEEATLVIDTGLGHANGETVLAEARALAPENRIYLVTTHYHPEHAGGSSAFPPDARFILSGAQRRDLDELAIGIAERFATLSEVNARLLDGVRFRAPDIVFETGHGLSLGGVRVEMLAVGPTHTGGDTAIFVEDDKVLFAGDVVMNRTFLSFNQGSSGAAWLEALDRLERLGPETIVPSHGAMGGASLIAEQREVIGRITARVDELRAAGRSVDRAVDVLTQELFRLYPDWSMPNRAGAAVQAIWAESSQ